MKGTSWKKIKKIEDVISILLVQSVPSLKARWKLFYNGNEQCPFTINFIQLTTIIPSPPHLFCLCTFMTSRQQLRKETSLAGNSDRGGLLKRCVLVHSFCRNKHEFIPALCSKQGQVHIAPFIGITARFHNTPDIPESILQLLHGEQFQAMPLPWIGLMLVIFLLFTRFAVLKVIQLQEKANFREILLLARNGTL